MAARVECQVSDLFIRRLLKSALQDMASLFEDSSSDANMRVANALSNFSSFKVRCFFKCARRR